jgi:hypothetical protein
MRSIFISYRRGDAEGQAGRLFSDLVVHFGKDSVFMDVEDIEPGRDFRKVIDQHVSSCGVLLSLVGKGWLNATDNDGHKRLDDPNDFVRLETASALRRDIPVVPVLVQGASMPKEGSLPDDLKEFAFRNAVELTHARWESDVQILLKALSRHVDAGETREATTSETVTTAETKANGRSAPNVIKETEDRINMSAALPPQGKMTWISILIAAIVAIALAAGGYAVYYNTKKAAEAEKAAAQKAAVDRAAAEKAAEEQKKAATKTLEAKAAAEQAVAKEEAVIEHAKKERMKAQMDAENVKKIATITNVTFVPHTGSTLYNGQQANVLFSYQTTETSGVRIFIRPLTNGKSTPHYAASGALLHKSGSGTGRCYFRISSGKVMVDNVKITMTDSNRKVLYERDYPVSFVFKER